MILLEKRGAGMVRVPVGHQSLISQVSAQRRIPLVERTFFMLASEYRSMFRKDAMTSVSYERCEFRVKESF